MTPRLQHALLFALLGSTALAPAALAQEQAADQAAAGCDALGTLIEENRNQLREEWINEANNVVAADDAAQCDELHRQASAALEADPNQAGDGEADQQAAQIVVTQPDPTVTVEQQAPEVAVSQPQPSVSIDQGQPEILVRQKSPTVSVQLPQPVITIEQPQPEIIIRMPDPQVAVSNPQPQVEVRQAEPRVTVQQAEPQVSVRGEEGGGANVAVEQGEPNVQLQTAEGRPQVEIQRQEPKVSFEAAEPSIDVQMMGEPEIRFSQTGEPVVRFEEFGEEQRETAEAGQQAGAGQPDENVAEAGPELDREQPDQQQTAETESQPMPQRLDQQERGGDPQTAETEQQSGESGQQAVDDIETGAIQQQDQTEARPQRGEQQDVASLILSNGQPVEEGQPQEYAAADLIGQEIVNQEDVALGTIETLVEAGDQRYIVLGSDSVLGNGESGVVLPLANVQMVEDRLVLRGLTEDEYAALQQYDGSNAEEIAADQTIEVATR